MKITVTQSLEWFGILTAIVYSLLVASNTGLEFRIRPFAYLCLLNRFMGLLGGSPRHSIAAVFLCDRGNHRYVTVVSIRRRILRCSSQRRFFKFIDCAFCDTPFDGVPLAY